MVANTPNGRTPHIRGGIALLPLGPNGEKTGVDDLLARGWSWNDIQAFIYPYDQVFNMKNGEFAPAPGLLSSSSTLVSENDGNQIADLLPAQSVAEFLEEAPVSYDWIIEGVFAKGAVTKLAGKAKESGKTTLLMCGVSEVLVGTPFLGRQTKKARVTYLSEQASNLREALKDAGIDDPEVEGLSLVSAYKVAHMDWQELTNVVKAYCTVHEVDLLIIDTLVDFSEVEDEGENSAGKVKATIKPLKHLAQSKNIAIVFTQHHNLEGRGRGSTQFDGDPDINIDLLAPDQISGDVDRNVRLLKAIGRGVNFHQFVKFTPDSGYEGLNSSDEDLIAVDRKAKVVLRFLPILEAEARTIKEITSALETAKKPMSEATVRRHLEELKTAELALEKGDGNRGSPYHYWRTEPAPGSLEPHKDDSAVETFNTNLFASFSETGSGDDANDDANKNEQSQNDGNVVPIRPNIEVKEEKKKKPKPPPAKLPTPEELAEKLESYVHTAERLSECHQWIKQCPEIAIDIETKGKNKDEATLYTKATIRGVILHHGDKSWFLDCDHLEDGAVNELLKELVNKPKYFHHSAFDVPRIQRRFGILLNKHVKDTLVASRAARAGEWEEVQKQDKKGRLITSRPKKGLDLAECIQRELAIEIPKEKQKWAGPLTETHMHYAIDDVAYLKDLYDALERRIEALGVKTVYGAIADTVHMFLESAASGIPVNAAKLEKIQTEVGKEKDELENKLRRLAEEHIPHPEGLEWVWRNSDKDTSPEGKGRAGMHRMLQMVGVKLSNLELEPTLLDNRDKHPLVKALYDYRKVAQEHSKYRRILDDFYESGRMFSQVKIAGAVTSRVLYTETNIQGFDKKKTTKYRECIEAEEGHTIIKGDFAQQELRIAAWWSEDKDLLAAFENGEDVYMRVAKKIAKNPKLKRGTKKGEKARAAAKRAVLGYLYGLGPEKYRKNVYKDTSEDISLDEAKRDREAFRAAYSGFYQWQKRYGFHKDETNLPKKDMWETRSVRGWRRVVAGQYERKSEWQKENNIPAKWIPKYTDRLNGPIQATAGDILYLTLAKLNADLEAGVYAGTRFLFTAHDEVVLSCPEGVARDVAKWLKTKMVEAFEEILGPELGGDKCAEVGGGKSWGATEDWF